VTTKEWVAKIGGFAAIADMLAGRLRAGQSHRQGGWQDLLSREVVATMYPAQGPRSFWQHQVRWTRTVRLSRPLSFLGLIFTHGLPWAFARGADCPNLLDWRRHISWRILFCG